ncbi:helix-turn-helix domain-containing protein [Bacillus sp. 1NLA3E]|uniref:helix-turn-helix domain-containing protein n=1 Tax=Bacillus sp. 1NLA3E TaxID=666686 RepID=UPI000247E6BC|nr:helix-turn-helix transcriptional regulator [Bacillus sp. 1NLA3E]AGK55904.1 hypothetical protein B1NLA3E_20830 [Bacillus sp. 1NLA3E]
MKNKTIKIGKVLEKLRKARELSQEEVAFRCGISRKSMSNLEKDRHLPNLITLINIASALDMKPHELMKEIEKDIDLLERATDD